MDGTVSDGRADRGSAAGPVLAEAPDRRLAEIHGLVAAGGPRIELPAIRRLRDGRVVAVSASPQFPDDADPQQWSADAEQLGVGLELELAVVTAALSTFARLLATLPEAVSLLVDVAPATVLSPRLRELLDGNDLPVLLQLSEQVIGEDGDRLASAVGTLRGSNAGLAVTGVTAGYPGLRSIVRLHPEVVRLDPHLVHEIDRDIAGTELVRAMVRFTERIGAVLVADGIAEPAELERLLDLGVPAGDGPMLGGDTPPPHGSPATTGPAPSPDRRREGPRTLEELVRPILQLVVDLTGLETAYLTVLHPDRTLEHRFVANTGALQVPEGLTIPWIDSLCKRCRDAGLLWTDDVPNDLPPIPLGKDAPIQTFVSVPVPLPDGRVAGTLCAMSSTARRLDGEVLAELQFFARLLGDRFGDEFHAGPGPTGDAAPAAGPHHPPAP